MKIRTLIRRALPSQIRVLVLGIEYKKYTECHYLIYSQFAIDHCRGKTSIVTTSLFDAQAGHGLSRVYDPHGNVLEGVTYSKFLGALIIESRLRGYREYTTRTLS